MRVGSMFAGIGGFDLAARWMGWETAWYTEIDPFCCATMAHHFPEARSLGDVTAVDWGQVEPVDLMCGGFPCQDISVAGKRKGIHGERSGLWKEYARAIRDLRPRWVVVENVGRLLRAGYDVVRGDLRAAGYRVARPVLLSASALGAPHERQRLWIVAHTRSTIGRSPPTSRFNAHGDRPGWEEASGRVAECGQAVGHADSLRESQPQGIVSDIGGRVGEPSERLLHPWAGGVLVRGTDSTVRLVPPPESGVWPVAHGVSHRVAQLRAVGNSIVPQAALLIFQAIEETGR